MTKPLTAFDLEYIEQAKHVVATLLQIVEGAEDRDGELYMFYLDAARGYTRDAAKWLENAHWLHHYEMDLVRAAVSIAHHTTNLFIQHCKNLIPMADHLSMEQAIQKVEEA